MTLVFDAEPLVAFYLGEPAGRRVEGLLDDVARGRDRAYVSRVNLAEVLYVLGRKDERGAEQALRRLEGDGVVALACEPAWQEAAALKRRHGLGLGDAFAAASARAVAGRLVLLRDRDLRRACEREGIPFVEV